MRSALVLLQYPKRESEDRILLLMSAHIVWYGTQEESFDLVNAVARNCSCEFGLMGVRLTTCMSHQLLVDDQRALNGLLFARRIVDQLRAEEWSTESMRETRTRHTEEITA